MAYQAPVEQIAFILNRIVAFPQLAETETFAEATPETLAAVLSEAGKLATEVIAPVNRAGDLTPARLENGRLRSSPGYAEAFRALAEGGWIGIAANPEYGGMGLPQALNMAVGEMVASGCLALQLNPLLTQGQIEALEHHGSDALKSLYLPKLISGEWSGTMNLTEPQAGSDLNALRSKAERVADGTYRITGQKIFITYGEHDLTDNIVHLVLARLPDAPPGTRGISLFLVPKYLVNADGSLGAHNDLRCSGIEHKLGIHASPTCSMAFGDKDGAIGWLIGEENRGLACMFTMMNNARLNVALQGVAIAERAYQHALAFAHERKQGTALDAPKGAPMSPIIVHPDVRRMLMDMRAKTQGARAISYQVAEALDRSHRETDEARRKAASERAAILTPIAKAYATDIGIDVASTGIQVHGGMGFVEETGAAQHLRDARIAAIYEGTNGIQAIDLVTRKLPLSQGDAVHALIAEMRDIVGEVERANTPGFGHAAARLGAAVDSLERATEWMLGALGGKPADALAGATPYLKLFALAQGGTGLAKKALATRSEAEGTGDLATARFYAECIATEAPALELAVTEGAGAIADAAAVFAA